MECGVTNNYSTNFFMKKHFPLLTLLLGLSVTTVASPIQPQRAKQLAENFFGGIKARKAPLKITYQAQKWQP